MDQAASPTSHLLEATTSIVASFVGHNALPSADLAALISEVHGALTRLGDPVAPPEPVHTPAVPVKKSITPDALISLIDGKPYKSLKRHLTGHGLTPDEYRARYSLPRDYPMVAASYSAQRTALAKASGLGQLRKRRAAPTPAETPVPVEAPKRRGRPAKR